MRSKTDRILALCLMAAGIIMIGLALALVGAETAETDIIGGAGWPTFSLVWRRGQGGLYGYMTIAGIALLAAGVIVGLVKKSFRR